MKETIATIMEILKDRSYEMTPELNKLLMTLMEDLDRDVNTIDEALPRMIDEFEIQTEIRIIEFAQYLTCLPKKLLIENYGNFKLIQSIENQLQNGLN